MLVCKIKTREIWGYQPVLESSNYDIKTEEVRFLVSAHESEKRRLHIPFSAKLDADFKAHYCSEFMLHRRLALWVLLVFVFIIGVLDLVTFGEAWMALAPVKTAVIAVAIAVIILLARSDLFDKYQYEILVLAVCALSFIQAFSLLYLPQGVYAHYIPLFIASAFVAGVCMRIPLAYYLFVVIATWLAFNSVIMLIDQQPVYTQMAYNTYFILASFLGGVLLFILERGARKEYVKSRLVSIEREELNHVSELLSQLDNVDPVTGLSNIKHFSKSLGVEWHRAIRNGKALSVLAIEIDDFESQATLFGQGFTQKYLFEVAKVLTQNFKRAGDLIAIDNQNHYLVMLPDVERESARTLCERVQARVAELPLTYPETDKPITITIGQATCVPGAEDSRVNLLSWAEQALAQAKLKGEYAHAEFTPNTMGFGGEA